LIFLALPVPFPDFATLAVTDSPCDRVTAFPAIQLGQNPTTVVLKMALSRPPGTLSEDEAAASLFMSKRTLARKLKQERTSFGNIRGEILSQQAASYLRDSQLSIEAIAALMNYHDSANFRRAFKRWFDQPPERFRLNVRAQTLHPPDGRP
jgi:AraC-like DNA-binding protein